MKKYLALLIISLLVFSACSQEPETKEANIATEESSPENSEDKESMDSETSNEESEDQADEEMVDEAESEPVEETVEEAEPTEEVEMESALLELTLDELKAYDGSNGNPAYIAIEGKVYDVTDIPNWTGGSHNGFKAGLDLTEEMKEISPHGLSKLQLVQEVGIIIE